MFADSELLEFSKILNELKQYAVTDLGKTAVLSIEPTNVSMDVSRMLDEVACAKRMIERFDETPMTGVLNIAESLKRARIGSTLSIEELLRIVSFVEAELRTERYIRKIRQLEIDIIPLETYYQQISFHPHLKDTIDTCIDPKGEIYDSASAELAQVRKKITILEKRIQEKMQSLLHLESNKLTDSIITIRNNRLVLPVKAEFKNVFKGIVHDMSSSKETVFVEPMICVEMNNNLQSYFAEERDAIDRILYRLSQSVALDQDSLRVNLEIFTQLDVIFSKAKRAIKHQETMPILTRDIVDLKNARHPLIPRETVVANTIGFGTYRSIVITGPNTGGKTVCLKTLGLLSIMVQAGLFIPVDEGSKTIVFTHVFADIGDEQSIEQSLSTFSSHITKIIYILNHLEAKSLVLLDELGSGTDPKEGASLAMSLLDHIRGKDVYQMVTTHYPELKIYAYNLDDTINASVEFDIETLQPTYRLQIGIPGTSNALDIALRLGLDQMIVDHARQVSLTFDNETANLIKKLEHQSKLLAREVEDVKSMKHDYQEKLEAQEQINTEARLKHNQLLKKLAAEKKDELRKAKETAETLIQELDVLKKQATIKEHEIARMKYAVKNLEDPEEQPLKTNLRTIQIGDRVHVIPYARHGVVMRKRGADFEVQMGALTSVFSEEQLEYSTDSADHRRPESQKVIKEGVAHTELDLRGKRYEEAMDALDKFVDDCLFHHLEFCSIIHGFGTGALKKGVLAYIKQNKMIKSHRSGGMNEGGQGVTIIYFK